MIALRSHLTTLRRETKRKRTRKEEEEVA